MTSNISSASDAGYSCDSWPCLVAPSFFTVLFGCVGGCTSATALMSVIHAHRNRIHTRMLLMDGVCVQGRVTKRWQKRGGGKHKRIEYWIAVQFQTVGREQDARTIVQTIRTSSSDWAQIGASIEICYLPSQPIVCQPTPLDDVSACTECRRVALRLLCSSFIFALGFFLFVMVHAIAARTSTAAATAAAAAAAAAINSGPRFDLLSEQVLAADLTALCLWALITGTVLFNYATTGCKHLGLYSSRRPPTLAFPCPQRPQSWGPFQAYLSLRRPVFASRLQTGPPTRRPRRRVPTRRPRPLPRTSRPCSEGSRYAKETPPPTVCLWSRGPMWTKRSEPRDARDTYHTQMATGTAKRQSSCLRLAFSPSRAETRHHGRTW